MKLFPTIFALSLACVALGAAPMPAHAAVSAWQKGVIIDLGAQPAATREALADALDDAADVGVNFITYVIPYYQENGKATAIFSGGNTPSNELLTDAVRLAHDRDMGVMLKPSLEAEDYAWRPLFSPSDRQAWFASYEAMLLHLAHIAQKTGVEQLCIGSGLYSMTSQTRAYENTKRWEGMIASVRKVYKGSLTYSALDGWPNEKEELRFWGKLDYIGIAAFHPLSQGLETPSETSLRESWDAWYSSDLRLLQEEFGKPLLFTEIGYKSVQSTHRLPLDWREGGTVSQQEQESAYQAAFAYWTEQPRFAGMHFWKWEVHPTKEQLQSGYTPQGKKALEVMRRWFMQSPFRATGYVAPPRPVASRPAQVHVRVQSVSPSPLQDTQVIITVCDAKRECAPPSVHIDQDFMPRSSLEYVIDWTPPASGSYAVMIQVLKKDGSRVLWKKDKAMTLLVKANTTKKSRRL